MVNDPREQIEDSEAGILKDPSSKDTVPGKPVTAVSNDVKSKVVDAITSSDIVSEEPLEIRIVSGKYVNYRSEPSTENNEPLGRLTKGDRVEVIGYKGKWLILRNPKVPNSMPVYLYRRLTSATEESPKIKTPAGKRALFERLSIYNNPYDMNSHVSTDILSRTYYKRLEDHELLLDGIKHPKDMHLKKLNKILFPNPGQQLVFMDIGPGIGNQEDPAVSSWEMASKFPDMDVVIMDLPEEVDKFSGKSKGKAVETRMRDKILNYKNIHIMAGDGYKSLLRQYRDKKNNPYPERKRPVLTPKTTVVIRAANSIDVYGDWEKDIKPALQKMAEDYKSHPVLLLFNREILVKKKGSTEWNVVGMTSNMGFRHNDRELTRDGHPPFKLDTRIIDVGKKSESLEKYSNILVKTKPGDQGYQVKNLQRALVKIGYLDKKYVTGFFGEITKTAVIKFQMHTGIIKDADYEYAGYFGDRTKATLERSLLNPQDAKQLKQQKEAEKGEIFTEKLVPGAKGPKVKKLQQTLAKLGLLSEKNVNSVYDDPTKRAVKIFQLDGNLIPGPDYRFAGFFGERTMKALNEALMQLKEGSKVSRLSRNIAPGSSGPRVEKMQEALVKLGLLDEENVTGFYGKITRRVITDLQIREGLIADKKYKYAGYLGNKTRALINRLLSEKKESELTFLNVNIAPGSRGVKVKRMQDVLHTLGLLKEENVTGFFGRETRKALVNFQMDEKLIRNKKYKYAGYLGERTRASLNKYLRLASAPSRQKEVMQLFAQRNYYHILEDKYVPETEDKEIQRRLFRVNQCKRPYVDELKNLNSSLPPMSEKCRMSICFPAYNEEGNIERTLSGWLNQMDPKTGQRLDPQMFEIIILINRPNENAKFDKTLEKINRFKRKHPEMRIHPVVHTFNFNKPIIVNGKELPSSKGVYMGTIYKMTQDLALLRNIQRKDKHRIAQHLFRSNGADTESRNPLFLDKVFSYFEEDPELDSYRSEQDYPAEAFKKFPLYHVAYRIKEFMNYTYTEDKRRSPIGAPGSTLGLGSYKSALYAEAGGFAFDVQIAEEKNLRRRIAALDHKGMKNRVINAIGNPRRSIMAMKNGVPLFRQYDDYQEAKGVRSSDWRDELKYLPPNCKLTIPNLEKELSAILTGWSKIIAKTRGCKNEREGFEKAVKMMKRGFILFGVGYTPSRESSSGEYEEHFEFVYDPTRKQHKVKLGNIDFLKKLVGEYRVRTPDDRYESIYKQLAERRRKRGRKSS